jgi:hypothetical protein
MSLIQDNQWLGYRMETGGLRTGIRSGMNVYYQPIYEYANGAPVFTVWRRINVSWSTHIDVTAGDSVPFLVSYVVDKLAPTLVPFVGVWGALSTVDALVVAKADQIQYTMVATWPPVSGSVTGNPAPVPIPNQHTWPNPNGLYPPVPGR